MTAKLLADDYRNHQNEAYFSGYNLMRAHLDAQYVSWLLKHHPLLPPSASDTQEYAKDQSIRASNALEAGWWPAPSGKPRNFELLDTAVFERGMKEAIYKFAIDHQVPREKNEELPVQRQRP